MSRVGKKPIEIPSGVEVKVDDNQVSVKGPKGALTYATRPEVKVEVKEGKILVSLLKEKEGKILVSLLKEDALAFWGLTRAIIANMVKGVVSGYEKKLEITGVGFRANVEGQDLVLNIGFSHPVKIKAPEGISFSVGKNIITVSGIDKGLVGQIAAKIRKTRPPEPYKGKGIKYITEQIRRKEGKKAVTTTT